MEPGALPLDLCKHVKLEETRVPVILRRPLELALREANNGDLCATSAYRAMLARTQLSRYLVQMCRNARVPEYNEELRIYALTLQSMRDECFGLSLPWDPHTNTLITVTLLERYGDDIQRVRVTHMPPQHPEETEDTMPLEECAAIALRACLRGHSSCPANWGWLPYSISVWCSMLCRLRKDAFVAKIGGEKVAELFTVTIRCALCILLREKDICKEVRNTILAHALFAMTNFRGLIDDPSLDAVGPRL